MLFYLAFYLNKNKFVNTKLMLKRRMADRQERADLAAGDRQYHSDGERAGLAAGEQFENARRSATAQSIPQKPSCCLYSFFSLTCFVIT